MGLVCVAGWARGYGVLNTTAGTYTQTFGDGLNCALVQAVTFNGATLNATVAGQWTWSLQGTPPVAVNHPVATEELFNDQGSATAFAAYVGDANNALGVQLYQRWFSAAEDMLDAFGTPTWQNDCKPPHRPGDKQCLIYRAADKSPGVRSQFVLDVPDVATFNDAQCAPAVNPAKCFGSLDFTFVDLAMYEQQYPDLLRGGRPVVATWMLRSPGENPEHPLLASEYNNRLAAFRITYTWTVNGGCGNPTGGTSHSYYYGGAVSPTICPADPNISGCDFDHGCPIRLLDNSPVPYYPGSVTLYLNSGGKSPYTPYTMSFCVSEDQFACTNCASLSGSLKEVCCAAPVGVWDFALMTAGTGIWNQDASGSTPKCPNVVGAGTCEYSRGSASLFIDGLMITAGNGSWRSPVFDSLSPCSQWTEIDYDVDTNATGPTGIRTPIGFKYSLGNAYPNWGSGASLYNEAFMTQSTTGTFASTNFVGSQAEFLQLDATLFSWDYGVFAANPMLKAPQSSPFGNPWPTASADPVYAPLGAGNLAQPPAAPLFGTSGGCENYSWNVQHDGTLTPRLKGIRAVYTPDAGRIVSDLVAPASLQGWRSLTYAATDANNGGSGSVYVDVIDQSGTVVLSGLTTTTPQPVALTNVDPRASSGLKIQFRLYRNCSAGSPAVGSFALNWAPMTSCLALSRNAVHLSRLESVVIRFCTAAAGTVDVRVHDSAGQLVVKLFHGPLAAGPIQEETWDGLNARREQVAPGVYFVTVITPTGRESGRLAVTR